MPNGFSVSYKNYKKEIGFKKNEETLKKEQQIKKTKKAVYFCKSTIQSHILGHNLLSRGKTEFKTNHNRYELRGKKSHFMLVRHDFKLVY